MADRQIEIDAAKGVCIILVVYWHAILDPLLISKMLQYLRMPLFFLLSGVFAGGAMSLPYKKFLVQKFWSMIWLYIVWTFILFFFAIVPYQIGEINWMAPFKLFTQPPPTVWFIYVLAICYLVSRSISWMPTIYAIGFSLLFFCINDRVAEMLDSSIGDKAARLLPFFLIGSRLKKIVEYRSSAAERLWFIPVLAYLFLAYSIETRLINSYAELRFLTGLVGIAGTILLLRHFSGSGAVKKVAWVGRSSFDIFVMHRIVLHFGIFFLGLLGLRNDFTITFLLVPITVLSTAYFGKKYLITHAPWLT
jgi:fucose 4-O-acetylase-like acetyltransferase